MFKPFNNTAAWRPRLKNTQWSPLWGLNQKLPFRPNWRLQRDQSCRVEENLFARLWGPERPFTDTYDELSLQKMQCLRQELSFSQVLGVCGDLQAGLLEDWLRGAHFPHELTLHSQIFLFPCCVFWIRHLLISGFHFRFCSTMVNWTSLWQVPWQSVPCWPWNGKNSQSTKGQKEGFGRSSNLIRKWLVMYGKWVNSTRYANPWGTQGMGVGW